MQSDPQNAAEEAPLRAVPNKQATTAFTSFWRGITAPRIAVVCLVLFVMILLGRILFSDLDSGPIVVHSDSGNTIGSPSSDLVEVGSLQRANDHLLQLVQWTIGLVITVGGTLVGFNWFQSRSRYQEDRERLLEIERKTGEKLQQVEEEARANKPAIEQIERTIDWMVKSSSVVSERTQRHEREIERMRYVARGVVNLPLIIGTHKTMLEDAITRGDLDLALGMTRATMNSGAIYAPPDTIKAILSTANSTVETLFDAGVVPKMSRYFVKQFESIFDDAMWDMMTEAAIRDDVAQWKELIRGIVMQMPSDPLSDAMAATTQNQQ